MSKTRLRTTVKKQRGGAPPVNKCKTAYPELYNYVKINSEKIKQCITNKDFTTLTGFFDLTQLKITVPGTTQQLDIYNDDIISNCKGVSDITTGLIANLILNLRTKYPRTNVVKNCETDYPELYEYVKTNYTIINNYIISKNFTELSKLFSLKNSSFTVPGTTQLLKHSWITVPGTTKLLKINDNNIIDTCSNEKQDNTTRLIVLLLLNLIKFTQQSPSGLPAPKISDHTRLTKWVEEIKKYENTTNKTLQDEFQTISLELNDRSTNFVKLIRHQYELFEIAIQINAKFMKLPDNYTMNHVLNNNSMLQPFDNSYFDDINTLFDFNTINISVSNLPNFKNTEQNRLLINKKSDEGVFFDSLSRLFIHLKHQSNSWLMDQSTTHGPKKTFVNNYCKAFIKANLYSQCFQNSLDDKYFKVFDMFDNHEISEIFYVYKTCSATELMKKYFDHVQKSSTRTINQPSAYYDDYIIVENIKFSDITKDKMPIKEICYAIQLIYYLEKNEPNPTPTP